MAKLGNSISPPRQVTYGRSHPWAPSVYNLCEWSATPHKPFLHVDDTALLITGNFKKNHHDKNTVWRTEHCLQLVRCKKALHESSKDDGHVVFPSAKLSVSVNNNIITPVSHFEDLGVSLNCHLTFDEYSSIICMKVDQCSGLLWRIPSFVLELALCLYKSLVHPHLT